MSLRAPLAVSLLSLTLLSGAHSAPSAALSAGADRVDITPPQSSIRPGDLILDHLYARAIVIRNASGGCAVLVGLDHIAARDAIVDDALSRASTAIHCPRENFILSATHDHSAATEGPSGGLPSHKDVADAVVKAVTAANARLAPARIGYGTTKVYFNVNRDLYEDGKWIQGPNLDAPSDKTLAVIALIGKDNLPIGFYMNYAMHPIDFYLTGVMSGAYSGQASRWVEQRYDGNTVAIFAQGASGDQNPLLVGPMQKLSAFRTGQKGRGDEHYGAMPPWEVSAHRLNGNADALAAYKAPLKPEQLAEYKKDIAIASQLSMSMGTLLGESALDVMKNHMPNASADGAIWAGEKPLVCPGRDRLDESARQGVLPPYKDGAPVNLLVGLLRIGDIDIVRVNGEVYNDIWRHLRDRMGHRKALMTTLANGAANSGYIYSNAANDRLTFQVISSRLKPGCAEDGIINTALELAGKASR